MIDAIEPSEDAVSEVRGTPFAHPVATCVAIGLAILVYLFLSFISFNQIEEDAYIYFKTAANISDGYGYVFNRGQEPTEVGSSNIWLFVLVLLSWLPIDIVLSAKFTGIFFGVLSLLLLHRIARRLTNDPVLSVVPCFLTACSTPFLFWNQRGLETPLYTLSILLLVYISIDKKWIRSWPLVAAMLLLGRPETLLILLGLIPALYYSELRARQVVVPAMGLMSIAIALEMIRLAYFKDFLPQPFYLKMSFEELHGARSVLTFVTMSHLQYLAIPLVVSVFRKGFRSPQTLIVFVYALLLVAWAGIVRDPQPYFRHLAPAVPLLYVLLVHGWVQVVAKPSRIQKVVVYCYCAFALVLTAAMSDTNGPFHNTIRRPLAAGVGRFFESPIGYSGAILGKMQRPYARNDTDFVFLHPIGSTEWSLSGDFVRANYAEGITVFYDQMGQAPFRAGLDKVFIDTFGLTDKATGYHIFLRRSGESLLLRLYSSLFSWVIEQRLAPELVHREKGEILEYLFSLEPELIMINRYVVALQPESLTSAVSRDSRLVSDYELAFGLAKFVQVYERKDFHRSTDDVFTPAGLRVVDMRLREVVSESE